jgi:hypothetical protein
MPEVFFLTAIVLIPAAVIVVALALIGSSIALLAEHDPLVGRAR